MKISMYAMSVELLVPMLQNLSGLLDKGRAHAEAKKFDLSVLVDARLAPDMLPFVKQIQIACDMAKNGVARLAGQEAPRFEDNEKTFDELKARIARTIDYIRGFDAGALEGSETRDIQISVPNRTFEFKGLSFLQRWLLPNFYFHVVTAYDILRHNGVDIGKADFLGKV